MIEELNKQDAKGILALVCMILGMRARETGVPIDEAKTLNELILARDS
jgi:hypothetical protein